MRPIIVHSLTHCDTALQAAEGRPVTLLTPPGGCSSLGAAYLWAMFEEARARHPGGAFTPLVDAGDAPGHALGALRTGFRELVFTGKGQARISLEDIARQLGGRLHPTPLETLDLLGVHDPLGAARAWLGVAKSGTIL
ncbi:MAG: hypothetical protein J0L97_10695 [Alphaproteobacteria bacterium]|nr:hypothetical protein [Alphaproteobacteria bacterium]